MKIKNSAITYVLGYGLLDLIMCNIWKDMHTHTHTHMYVWCVCVCIYIYIYIYMRDGLKTKE